MEIGSLIFSFLTGILSFLSPCLIPMILVYLTLITGLTFDELLKKDNHQKVRKDIFFNTLYFVLGFLIIFSLAGGMADWLGRFFKERTVILNQIGGIFIIFFGLHLIGLVRLKFLERIKIKSGQKVRTRLAKAKFLGPFLVGIFFAVACSHCIGPLLYSMLIFAGTTGAVSSGILIMFFFSVGLAIPYLIISLVLSRSFVYLEKLKKHLNIILKFSGFLLIILGFLIFFNKFIYLVGFFYEILPYSLPFSM